MHTWGISSSLFSPRGERRKRRGGEKDAIASKQKEEEEEEAERKRESRSITKVGEEGDDGEGYCSDNAKSARADGINDQMGALVTRDTGMLDRSVSESFEMRQSRRPERYQFPHSINDQFFEQQYSNRIV